MPARPTPNSNSRSARTGNGHAKRPNGQTTLHAKERVGRVSRRRNPPPLCGEVADYASLIRPTRWRPLTPHTHLATSRSHSFAGQKARLLHPSGELRFVELVVLVDIEVAPLFALGLAGRDRTQRRAAEESHLDVVREAMEAEERGGPGFRD